MLKMLKFLKPGFNQISEFFHYCIYCQVSHYHLKPSKPVASALPVVPLTKWASPTGDYGNVNKRCESCRQRCLRGDVHRKHPYLQIIHQHKPIFEESFVYFWLIITCFLKMTQSLVTIWIMYSSHLLYTSLSLKPFSLNHHIQTSWSVVYLKIWMPCDLIRLHRHNEVSKCLDNTDDKYNGSQWRCSVVIHNESSPPHPPKLGSKHRPPPPPIPYLSIKAEYC